MSIEKIVEQTITTIRTTKDLELRIAANEHPDVTMTLEETANVVDHALQETLTALMDALGNEDEDEQSERDRWWDGYSEEHPYDTRWGKGTEDYPLPRVSSTSSWWDH